MKRIQIYLADLPISASHQCRHAIIYFHIAKNRAAIHSSVLKSCGRWDLNPHKRNAYKILSLARLPVPTLPHIIGNFQCGRWDLNPHERNAHKILSLARLPVPTLPHDRISLGFFIFSLATSDSIAKWILYVNTFFQKFSIFSVFLLFCHDYLWSGTLCTEEFRRDRKGLSCCLVRSSGKDYGSLTGCVCIGYLIFQPADCIDCVFLNRDPEFFCNRTVIFSFSFDSNGCSSDVFIILPGKGVIPAIYKLLTAVGYGEYLGQRLSWS